MYKPTGMDAFERNTGAAANSRRHMEDVLFPQDAEHDIEYIPDTLKIIAYALLALFAAVLAFGIYRLLALVF